MNSYGQNCTPNSASYGPGFAFTLASMSSLTDEGHAACPEEWRTLTATLHPLLIDEGYTTRMAAWALSLPEGVVADYRRLENI